MRKIFTLLALAATAAAQPVIAPGGERIGPPRGQDVDGYNIVQSFETGYRFHTVGGNEGRYRSDVNFRNGLRLLGSSLSIHSKEGHGRYFDELLLNTQGLGNDPYQISNLRIQKNRLYRYDFIWRQNAYYNPALPIAGGQHFLDTTRTLQDHSFTLFPQSSFKLFAGYSRNGQGGPGLSTVNLFDIRGDEFPLFRNVRRLQNEFRVGADITVARVRLSFLRGWEFFKDDTERLGTVGRQGNPEDLTILSSFHRAEPYHGTTKNWHVNMVTERSEWWTASGRFTYAEGRRDFIFDETALGADRFGAA